MSKDKDKSEEAAASDGPWQTTAPAPADETPPEAVVDTIVEAGSIAADADAPLAADDAAPVSPESSAIEPEPKSGGGRGWLILLVLLVVLIGGGYFGWPYLVARTADWLPGAMVAAVQTSGETRARLDDLESDVAGLKAGAAETAGAVAALRQAVEAMPAASGGGGGSQEALAQRLDDLVASVAALSDRNADLAGRIDALSTAAAGATAGGMAEAAQALQAGVAERLNQADARAELAERQAQAADAAARAAQAGLQALEQRLATLEQTPTRTPVGQQRAAILALGQLRAAVDAGRPYEAALQTVGAVFAEEDALAPLRPSAAAGIATLGDLKNRFPATIEAVLHARPEAGDIWQRTVQRLSNLITVRRIGEVEGEETDAILARAEVRLNRNDLAGTVAEMQTLDGPAAEAAQPWLRDAVARVEAERALDALQDLAVAKTAEG